MTIEQGENITRGTKENRNTQECVCSVCGKRSMHPLFSSWLCNSCRSKITADEMQKRREIRPGML